MCDIFRLSFQGGLEKQRVYCSHVFKTLTLAYSLNQRCYTELLLRKFQMKITFCLWGKLMFLLKV